MGAKESEKKRKRNAQDTDSGRSSKTRIIDTHDQEKVSPKDTSTTTKKNALARQEKSERRSKKAKRPGERKNKQHDEDAVAEHSPRNAERTITATTSEALVDRADHIPLNGSVPPLKPYKKPKDKKSPAEKEAGDSAPASTKPTRFIVFVGNLPYTATNQQLSSHFAKLATGIKSIRLGTDKQTGRGKGFAFLEFDGFEKMKTCLKLYHHSIFDPENKSEDKEAKEGEKEAGKGRRINVELTAGGGGKSKVRKEKIGAKNKKLDDEREREKLKEKAQAPKEGKRTMTGANGASREEEAGDTRGAIHPSRLSRVAK